MADEAHRPGPLKQQNKPHKHGKHKSKSSIDTINKGRVGLKSQIGKKNKQMKRVDRKNQMKQRRNNKRQEILASKRSLGCDGSPPHLIVCVPLSLTTSCWEVYNVLSTVCSLQQTSCSATTTVLFPVTKQRFTFLFPSSSDLYTILDAAKVADTLLFIYKADEDLSSFSELVLDTCSAQGLSSTCHVLKGLSEIPIKKRADIKRRLQENVNRRFPKAKLRCVDSSQDIVNVLRFVRDQKHLHVQFRDTHPHIVAEKVEIGSTDTEDICVLKVSGYVRGRNLSVNRLIHIPGLGDFQVLQIDSPKDPCPVKGHHKTTPSDHMITDDQYIEEMDEEVKILEIADPTKQESLVSEVVPDPMEGEQTWPTQEELEEAETAAKKPVLKKVPQGTSEYQAAWIIDSECDDNEEEEMSDGGSFDDVEENTFSESEEETSSLANTIVDSESVTVPDEDQYDSQMDFEEEKKQLEVLKAEKEYRMFPDEVDTPINIPARTRFAKYRGLRSFRSSPWDPKENLPLDYARIFQFENFRRTKKRVMLAIDDEGAMPGWYVTLHISRVPRTYAETIDVKSSPLVLYGLLPHENKMSVMNFVLKRTPHYSLPIKSKEELIFQSGVRRYTVCPIFSQHTLGDKHKYERFFQHNTSTVATVYAPIAYPPLPVLVFKYHEGTQVLVATGTLLSPNPNRIVCKKIILSGHPYKIHKRSAVIRYMFFNRDDINWFKPVELRTKHGCKGNIKEPLGTHGHMKCVFDKQLKAHDTVLMPLYKRVFPKWSYNMSLPHPFIWNHGNEEDSMTCE